MLKILMYCLFLIAIYYGISSVIKFIFNKDLKKLKKNLLKVGVAILVLSPFTTHFTLLKTSYTYNEMLDKRIYSQLLEKLTPYNIDNFYLNTRDLVHVPMYDVDVFNDISFHSSIKENLTNYADEDYSQITVRLNNEIQPIIVVAIDDQSDIFRVIYKDHQFHMLLPKLRNLLVEKLA